MSIFVNVCLKDIFRITRFAGLELKDVVFFPNGNFMLYHSDLRLQSLYDIKGLKIKDYQSTLVKGILETGYIVYALKNNDNMLHVDYCDGTKIGSFPICGYSYKKLQCGFVAKHPQTQRYLAYHFFERSIRQVKPMSNLNSDLIDWRRSSPNGHFYIREHGSSRGGIIIFPDGSERKVDDDVLAVQFLPSGNYVEISDNESVLYLDSGLRLLKTKGAFNHLNGDILVYQDKLLIDGTSGTVIGKYEPEMLAYTNNEAFIFPYVIKFQNGKESYWFQDKAKFFTYDGHDMMCYIHDGQIFLGCPGLDESYTRLTYDLYSDRCAMLQPL